MSEQVAECETLKANCRNTKCPLEETPTLVGECVDKCNKNACDVLKTTTPVTPVNAPVKKSRWPRLWGGKKSNKKRKTNKRKSNKRKKTNKRRRSSRK